MKFSSALVEKAVKEDFKSKGYKLDGGKFLGLVMMKAFYSAMDNVRAELRQPLKEEDYS